MTVSIQLDSAPTVTQDVVTATSSSISEVIVDVTETIVIDPTVTVSETVNPASTDVAGTDLAVGGVQTATATVTATFTVSNTAATALSSITLQEIFPGCANETQNIPAIAAITIPDMVLPSNLTLSQVLGFFGGAVDCSDLLQLLGVSNSTSGLTRRDLLRSNKRFRRYRKERR